METLSKQFEGALALIGLDNKRDRAVEAQKEIRAAVETSADLRALGVETVLIGSYGRETAIYPGKDVDVFTKLTKADVSHDPGKIFETVRSVLVESFGSRAKPQARSIKVDYPDEFAVDVVPAVPKDGHWAIPNHDPDVWDRDDERWVLTDPVRLTELTVAQNRQPTVGSRGAYVPTVKMVRQIRRHHLADRKPGGFYFELMTYHAFQDGVAGDSFAEILAEALRDIADQLAAGQELIDPALRTPYKPIPELQDRSHAANLFGELATQAEEALHLARCPAAAVWRRIFGRNENGACFPLPEGCAEDGKSLRRDSSSAASTASVKDSGFA